MSRFDFLLAPRSRPPGLADAAAFAALAALLLALAIGHVPWFDEVQAFILARDSGSLAEWWRNFRFEGHPPLWHLLIKLGLAATGDVSALALVQAAVALATLALIVFAAPFSLGLRVLIALGYFLLFEYGALARAYGLGAMLMLAACAFRGRWPGMIALALLPFVTAQFALLAILLWFLFHREGRAPLLLLAFVVAGLAAAYLFARPPADFVHADARQASVGLRLLATLANSSGLLVPFDPLQLPLIWERRLGNPILAMAVGAAVPVIAVLALAGNRVGQLAVAAFWTMTAGLSVLLALMANRHFGLVYVLFLVVAWQAAAAGRAVSQLGLAWIAAQAGFGVIAAGIALAVPFSPGREVARFLAAPERIGLPVMALPPFVGVDHVARNRREVVNIAKSCRDTFQVWDYYRHPALKPAEIVDKIKVLAAGQGGHALLVIQEEEAAGLAGLAEPAFRRIAAFTGALYFRALIFEIRVAPAPAQALPECRALNPEMAPR